MKKILIASLLFASLNAGGSVVQEASHSHKWLTAWKYDGGYLAAKKDFTFYTLGAISRSAGGLSNRVGKRAVLINNFYPQPIMLHTKWKDVSVANNRVWAITKSGKIYAWGREVVSDRYISKPRKMSPLNAWKTVESVGSNEDGECRAYTFAFKHTKRDYELYAWGYFRDGFMPYALGDRNSYTKAHYIGNDWKKVAMGCYTVYGLKNDGTLWKWGNGNGFPKQIHNNTIKRKLQRQRNMLSTFYTRVGNNSRNHRINAVRRDGTLWLKPVTIYKSDSCNGGGNGMTLKKPAIYLYPTKKEKITVSLKINGKLTKSIPKYKNGWSVIANKNGDIEGGYDYLFYENSLKQKELPSSGWIVKGSELKSWFENILPKLGLNNKEKTQFMEYWLKKLNSKKLYEIKLFSQEFLSKNVKLTISPKPDSIIRVIFNFKVIDKPYKLKTPIITTPKREGFNVLEWGGALETK